MKKLALPIILLTTSLALANPSIANLKIVNGKYTGVIHSGVKRVPDAPFAIPVPAKTPILMDSWFNECITYADHTPVQHTQVTIFGDDWGVDTNTSEAGCFDAKIPADANFTVKAMNPKEKAWAKLGGVIRSAKKGQLLDSSKVFVIPYNGNLANVSNITAEDGVKSYKVLRTPEHTIGFKITSDIKKTKHSLVLSVPTIVGKTYRVQLNTSKPLWVWFSDHSRKENPAKITSVNKLVPLHVFKATKRKTRLYLQPQSNDEVIIKQIIVKPVTTKPKASADNVCVPFGDKQYMNSDKSVYWRKCKRPNSKDWQKA